MRRSDSYGAQSWDVDAGELDGTKAWRMTVGSREVGKLHIVQVDARAYLFLDQHNTGLAYVGN